MASPTNPASPTTNNSTLSPSVPEFVPQTTIRSSAEAAAPAPKNALRNVPCRYFRAGYCFRGRNCWFKHDAPGRAVTAAVDEPARPDDEMCGICLEKVEAEYGLMTDCDHVFCLTCIRTWRDAHKPSASATDPYGLRHEYDAELASTSKTCPMCRKRSRFIIPSLVFPYPPANGGENVLKKNIEGAYLRKLASIPCRYFVNSCREIEEAAQEAGLEKGEGLRRGREKDASDPSPSSDSDSESRPALSQASSSSAGGGADTALSAAETSSTRFRRIPQHPRRGKIPICPFGNECHYKHEITPGKKFVYTDAELSRARHAASAQRRNRERVRSAVEYLNHVYSLPEGAISGHHRLPRWIRNALQREDLPGLAGRRSLETEAVHDGEVEEDNGEGFDHEGITVRESWDLSDEGEEDDDYIDFEFDFASHLHDDENEDEDLDSDYDFRYVAYEFPGVEYEYDEEDDDADNDDHGSMSALEDLAVAVNDAAGPVDPLERQQRYLRLERARIRREMPDLPLDIVDEHVNALRAQLGGLFRAADVEEEQETGWW